MLQPLLDLRRRYLPVRRWARAVGLAAPAPVVVPPPPPDPLAELLPRLFHAVGRTGDLGDWLVGLAGTAEFGELCAALNDRPDLRSITGADEVATLALLVGRLRPALTLEIGTFFAGTTRVLAEAAGVVGGRVVTLDPFGSHRVPGILAAWPAEVRARVEYRDATSMCYFAKLDLPKAGRSPLGVVFVDGNHAFEYALFDIIRGADHLTPGGAVVVDNMDQDGPRQAAAQFLDWNPAWRLFAGGRLYRAGDAVNAALTASPVGWGVLVAPAGVQVSATAMKVFEYNVAYQPIRAVRFHVAAASGPGTLAVKLNYHAYPQSYSVRGEGLVIDLRTSAALVTGAGDALAAFDPPAGFPLPAPNPIVVREMEVSFTPAGGGRGFVLLDATRPFSFD